MAAEGETVAVRVTAEPTVGVVVEAVSVVVVAVVPPPPPVEPGAFQKLPQPVSSPMPANAADRNTTLEEERIFIANSFPAAAAALRDEWCWDDFVRRFSETVFPKTL